MNNKALILSDVINEMKHIQLSTDDMKKFAFEAARLRFDDLTDVDIHSVFQVQRVEDESNDLWTVFNRIQENLTADISNFSNDIKLNQQLFSLAEQYTVGA
jgi:hypothetical protein